MTTTMVLHHNSLTHCISSEAKKPNNVYRVHTNTLMYVHMYHFILQAGRQGMSCLKWQTDFFATSLCHQIPIGADLGQQL